MVGAGDKVNSKAYKVYIRPTNTDIEYIQLQDKSFQPNHPIIIEPTTSGGITAYTGSLTDGSFSGTLLFTDDLIDAVGGYKQIATVNSTTFQRPINTWRLKLVDFANTSQTFEFKAMLNTFNLYSDAEGGTKYDIELTVTEFDPNTDIT